jgi:hypothetical protein
MQEQRCRPLLLLLLLLLVLLLMTMNVGPSSTSTSMLLTRMAMAVARKHQLVVHRSVGIYHNRFKKSVVMSLPKGGSKLVFKKNVWRDCVMASDHTSTDKARTQQQE